jgi:hypothetical protein
MRFSILVLLAGLLCAVPARAHELNTSYAHVAVTADSVTVAFVFDVGELAAAFELDADGDGIITGEELLNSAQGVYRYLEQRAALRVDATAARLQRSGTWFTRDAQGNAFMHFGFAVSTAGMPDSLALRIDLSEAFGRDHVNLVRVEIGDHVYQAALTAARPERTIHLERPPTLFQQVGAYTLLGIEHIFIGFDHILFLLALIIIGGTFWELVKIVTAFTIAHSITLILAALEIIVLPSSFVEPAIALSVAYVAAENFVIDTARFRWMVTFAFGLVHGFGFAGVLTELGLPRDGLAASLLAFNVGVEIGQIAIVALLFPLVIWVTRHPRRRRMVTAVSAVIFVFGLAWFVERVFWS